MAGPVTAREKRGFSLKRKHFALPYMALLVFLVLLPLALIIFYAFTDAGGGFTFENFVRFFSNNDGAIKVLLRSLWVGLVTTAVCLVLGYPVAFILSNPKLNRSGVMIMLFMLPMWVNFLLRTLATKIVFDFFSLPLGYFSLMFGMVYNFLPFMILPIYNVLKAMDKSLTEAAQDLGCSPVRVFLKVVLPLSVPGIISGILMVFLPTMTTYAISDVLTEGKIKLFGNTIHLFMTSGSGGSYNYGSALSFIMLIFIVITAVINKFGNKGAAGAGRGSML